MTTNLLRTALAIALLAGCSSSDSSAGPAAPHDLDNPSKDASVDARAKPTDVKGAPDSEGPADLAPRVDAAVAPTSSEMTYAANVRPILVRACVQCHSAGNIAPFSLDSYERAKPFASLIAKATRARTMPPSVIDASGQCNNFRDVGWLSEDEITTLERWAEDGAGQGDMSLPAPPAHELPKLSGEVVSIQTPAYAPSKEGPDDYRCFVIDSPFKEKTFVTGYDTKPGDSKTAHHMVVFYPFDDGAALIGKLNDELDPGPGYNCYGAPGTPATVIAAWAPGAGATFYPDKLGIPVEPGRPLIVQMHYNTTTVDVPGEDSTKIDFRIEKEGISEAAWVQVIDLEMDLPPGKTEAEEVINTSISARRSGSKGPIQIYGAFPHMHELGKNAKLTATDAQGAERCVIDAQRYEFHWQRMYFFDKPFTVDAADQLKLRCVYDTTSRTDTTHWGEGTQDEMCVTGMFVKLPAK